MQFISHCIAIFIVLLIYSLFLMLFFPEEYNVAILNNVKKKINITLIIGLGDQRENIFILKSGCWKIYPQQKPSVALCTYAV